MFDTLVKRVVSSNKDVYRLTAHLYEKMYSSCVDEFEKNRRQAELKQWRKTSEGSFTLDGIYRELESNYGKEVCDRLKKIEVFIEKTIIERNEDLRDLYDWSIGTHRVILTSDMYLSRNCLEDILHGIQINRYDKLYISGEKKCSKANGHIFDEISKELKSRNIIHFGDSLKGDYLIPKLKGWSSKHVHVYSNPYYDGEKCTTLSDSLLLGIINNKPIKKESYWADIGFSILGPLLLAYVSWIEANLRKEHINTIVFLARDGYIVKKVFDMMFPEKYKTRYMYISRKCATLATIKETSSLSDILKKIKFRQKESYRDVLKRLGVPENLAESEKDFQLLRTDIYSGKYDDKFIKYYSAIKENALEQKQFLSEYTNELFCDNKVAVVDVGWHGTIQSCLQEIVGDKTLLIGYYLGLEQSSENNKRAFFSKDCFNSNMIPFTRGVFETFFSADHPSTDGYKRRKTGIDPVYSTCNSSNETCRKIIEIQDGAVSFIKKYNDISEKLKLDIETLNVKMISTAFIKFCINPTYADVEQFGSIEFNDTSNRLLIDYIPGNMKKNLKSFMNSDWKAGYARKIFKVGLPYGKILACINRLRRKEMS